MTIHYLAKKVVRFLNPWISIEPRVNEIFDLLCAIQSKQQLRVQLYKQKNIKYNLKYNPYLLPSIKKLFKPVIHDVNINNNNNKIPCVTKPIPSKSKFTIEDLYDEHSDDENCDNIQLPTPQKSFNNRVKPIKFDEEEKYTHVNKSHFNVKVNVNDNN